MTNDLFYGRSYRLKDNIEKLSIFKLQDSVLREKDAPISDTEILLINAFTKTPLYNWIYPRFKENSNPKYLTKKFKFF